ncbi:uncharacterized protein FIBRA_08066 [Fibroporia radiculosa]|uniref:Uncharacterized protein n=1 Tax=Fibroporia radiculosa TaxID=599839 RepID=J4GW50_9APHY|nr:uncharacterized protein FIBRA_08066 [Fibroporia radiculosa]CCM05830.1 predicted protein [Fibroporia radiculosa]
MSAPVTVPSSGSPKYVPVHRRSPSSTSSSPSSHGDFHSRWSHAKPQNAHTTHISPHGSVARRPSFVYDISDLLALSSSSLVGLEPAKEKPVEELLAFTATPGGARDKTPRRRRAGRRTNTANKIAAHVSTDVESRRSRHGHSSWGWQVHIVGMEESWRHAPMTEIHA